METLNQKTQRYARELELEIRAGNTRGAVQLVNDWALSRDCRLRVARLLDQRLDLPADSDPIRLDYNHFDQARILKLAGASGGPTRGPQAVRRRLRGSQRPFGPEAGREVAELGRRQAGLLEPPPRIGPQLLRADRLLGAREAAGAAERHRGALPMLPRVPRAQRELSATTAGEQPRRLDAQRGCLPIKADSG